MKKEDDDALTKAAKEAQEIMSDPKKFEDFKKKFGISDEIQLIEPVTDIVDKDSFIKTIQEITKKWREEDEARDKKWREENPLQATCDHGVFFDEAAAKNC